MRIKLPARFFFDHMERDLPPGTIVHAGKALVDVEVTPTELEEIESDALYYADRDGPDGQPDGLKESAKRTLRRIEKFRGTKEGPRAPGNSERSLERGKGRNNHENEV
ncbi:hypothetical protein [Geomonas subterranea]|uniref:hypothetical protein n=1 Tax=Geomonas subterranea TaxID=2847989 RepID=UPI001CD26F30|nr:hypothetical protein [Geomonas fuzhouensis]